MPNAPNVTDSFAVLFGRRSVRARDDSDLDLGANPKHAITVGAFATIIVAVMTRIARTLRPPG